MPPLTREQQAIVDQPADVLLLVVADAGAGKTYALARRVERLVAEESPDAGEILVLTFSRTAVRELRARLAKYGNAANRVQAYAFDSWALDLLTRVDPDGDWPGRTSEEQLDAALQHLTTGIVDELYDRLLHVVVDEAQDLAGRRGEMVEALLERVDCGFTIAGDPEQAVHGPGAGTRFFPWLRETFGADLVEAGLTQNLRARTGEAAAALSRPVRLHASGESGPYEDLRAALGERVDVGRLDQGFAVDGLIRYEGTTGVLCRTTGQAMILSEELHRIGVPHRLRRSARERVVPSWVGRLVGKCDGILLTRPRFDELIAALPVPRDLSPDRLWRMLQRAASGRPADVMLDLSDLLAGISAGSLPDELTAQPPARFVVSSFHRAKGLEFDRVLVADPGPVPYGDPAEEARLLYLAMTRARYEMFHLVGPDMTGLAVDGKSGRWSRHSREGRAWMGMQVIEGDVHTTEPAGVRGFLADPAGVQSYLAARVEPGDEITLERLYLQSMRPEQSPPYLLMHEGRPIGTASGQFREQLYRRLERGDGRKPAHWPRTIDGIRADAVETVVGPIAAGAHAGLGPYGIWLAPRLVGIGRFVWDKNDQKEDRPV
jgi:hypothetical protein